MDLQPGMLVGHNLRLERLLGQGGMGSVWVADHLTLHTKVAVKFISADVSQQTDVVARFSREATAAAQIKSPHIVQVFDHGVTQQGLPYIVMELLEGEDLAKRIERHGPLAVDEIASIVSQVCKALTRAHAQGIVHRDIKPENIFLTESDGDVFVKVLDFGIAKRTQGDAMHMTSTGAMVGTPYFMSPEQILSAKGVDLRSDLWSLGVVAYFALTRTLPFVAETLGALCVAIDRGTFAPPSSLRPGLDPGLDAWFQKALAREPASRFSSAKEMAEALRHVVGGSPAYSTLSSSVNVPMPLMQPPGVPAQTLMDASITATRQQSSALPVIAIAGGVGLAAVVGLVVALLALRGSGSETHAAAAESAASLEVAPAPAAKPEPAPAKSVAQAPTASEKPANPSSPLPAATRNANRIPAVKSTATQSTPTAAPTPTKRDYGF